MAARRRTLPRPPDSPECRGTRHGDANAYDWYGCRCHSAREANRLRKKRSREGRAVPAFVSPDEALRMLRELAAIGHAPPVIAVATGLISTHGVRHLLRGRSTTMLRETDQAVRKAYADLKDWPGASPRTALWAAKAGWSPPPGWRPDEPREAAAAGSGDELTEAVVTTDALVSAAKYRGLTWDSMSMESQERVLTALRQDSTFAEIALLLGTTKKAVEKTSERINKRARDAAERAAEQQQEAEAS